MNGTSIIVIVQLLTGTYHAKDRHCPLAAQYGQKRLEGWEGTWMGEKLVYLPQRIQRTVPLWSRTMDRVNQL